VLVSGRQAARIDPLRKPEAEAARSDRASWRGQGEREELDYWYLYRTRVVWMIIRIRWQSISADLPICLLVRRIGHSSIAIVGQTAHVVAKRDSQ